MDFHYLMFDEPHLGDAYFDKLRISLKGAIRFAERRQLKREASGKSRVAVTLTHEQAIDIARQQGFRCALTRLMFYSVGSHSYGPSRPSLDRREHGGPYSAENVRIIMLGVNGLRGAGSDDDMYEIARALVANRPGGHGF